MGGPLGIGIGPGAGGGGGGAQQCLGHCGGANPGQLFCHATSRALCRGCVAVGSSGGDSATPEAPVYTWLCEVCGAVRGLTPTAPSPPLIQPGALANPAWSLSLPRSCSPRAGTRVPRRQHPTWS